jgi:hypothetical protein
MHTSSPFNHQAVTKWGFVLRNDRLGSEWLTSSSGVFIDTFKLMKQLFFMAKAPNMPPKIKFKFIKHRFFISIIAHEQLQL